MEEESISMFQEIETKETFSNDNLGQFIAQTHDFLMKYTKVNIVYGILATGRAWKFFRLERNTRVNEMPKMIYEGERMIKC
jgi:hypothetical protein